VLPLLDCDERESEARQGCVQVAGVTKRSLGGSDGAGLGGMYVGHLVFFWAFQRPVEGMARQRQRDWLCAGQAEAVYVMRTSVICTVAGEENVD
jgi:hypothetical protein